MERLGHKLLRIKNLVKGDLLSFKKYQQFLLEVYYWLLELMDF